MRKPLFFQRPLPYSYYNATIILIVINVLIYLLRMFAPHIGSLIYFYGTLAPHRMAELQNYYSFITYLFLHAPDTIFHILFNMFALFMFGVQIEKRIGSTEFLLYYLLTGTLTGVLLYFIDPLLPLGPHGEYAAYIGASASIFAVLLAFATFFPNARLLLFFVIPIRAYALVIGLAIFSVVAQVTGIFGQTAHMGHLAGLLFGFLYFVIRFRINPIKEFMNSRRYY